MEAAFAARDRAFDGRFVVCVTTTGIYCRPSCPARRPRPEHTLYIGTTAEARAAGYRACLRCLPDDAARDVAAVARAAAQIGAGEGGPLADLAAQAGYSPTHFQRIFTRATGLSPAAYARALRAGRGRAVLSGGGQNVTDAIYAAGYESPSRFYADMKDRLGMAPSAWRKGGAGVTIHWAVVETSLGDMLVAATDRGVCRLAFVEGSAFAEGQQELARRFPHAVLTAGGDDFAALLAQVVAAVEQPGAMPGIPLDVIGTAFQERVWAQLRAIPPGETRSYGELAAALGQPGAARAVGGANGANPVAVLVPCHRVIAADGTPGGYAYGLAIKRELLRREGAGGQADGCGRTTMSNSGSNSGKEG